MTRKEFLFVALRKATEEGVGIHLAKFADMCIEWATNEAIEKACEWLDENLENYVFEGRAGRPYISDVLFEDFKKSML